MSLGFVVVVTAIGLFVLAPLALAWVSTDPRRWSRVEGVLGRELPEGVLSPRWTVGLWVGTGAAYAAMGVVQARTEERDGFPWLSLLLGAAYMSNGVFNYVVYRRRRRAEESAQAQVEDRAEPRGPAPGG
jgi:hypothetical protein